jgi:hypothetical protein
MKRKTVCKILYVASALLLLLFLIASCIDAYKYYTGIYFGSAPFYLYLLLRGVQFLAPALVLCIVGLVLNRKRVKK